MRRARWLALRLWLCVSEARRRLVPSLMPPTFSYHLLTDPGSIAYSTYLYRPSIDLLAQTSSRRRGFAAGTERNLPRNLQGAPESYTNIQDLVAAPRALIALSESPNASKAGTKAQASAACSKVQHQVHTDQSPNSRLPQIQIIPMESPCETSHQG